MPGSNYYIGFIDVGFLKGAGASLMKIRKNEIQLDAGKIIDWLQGLEIEPRDDSAQLLRAYWYDGAYEPNHKMAAAQRRYLDAIALTPGVQLRLGNISETRSKLQRPILKAIDATAASVGIEPSDLRSAFTMHWKFSPERRQKGVDTRIVLDLVRLARSQVCRTAILVAGDRDLAEAVRTAQDDGCRVVVATPQIGDVAKELKQLADVVIEIDKPTMRTLVRSGGATASAATPAQSAAE